MSRRLLFSVVLGVVSSNAALAVSVVSGPVVNPANGHSYYLLDSASWTDSQTFAQTLGGNLVTINDAAENAWVYSTFADKRDLWLGLNDQQTEGTYVWASGETSSFTAWRSGQPDNYAPVGGEDFVHMYGSQTPFGAQWNDANNDLSVYGSYPWRNEVTPMQGVVEVVPVPSSLAAGLVLGGGGLLARAWRRRRA